MDNIIVCPYRYYYSSKPNLKPKPIKVFANADLNKLKILELCKNKCRIYMRINKNNDNKYVGNSVNPARRFRVYYDFFFLQLELKKVKV